MPISIHAEEGLFLFMFIFEAGWSSCQWLPEVRRGNGRREVAITSWERAADRAPLVLCSPDLPLQTVWEAVADP